MQSHNEKVTQQFARESKYSRSLLSTNKKIAFKKQIFLKYLKTERYFNFWRTFEGQIFHFIMLDDDAVCGQKDTAVKSRFWNQKKLRPSLPTNFEN